MALPESGTIAVLAEKPSVARDIARVVGAAKKGEGYLYGNGYVVTWAVGHLIALAQPHEMNPEWRFWRRDLRFLEQRIVVEINLPDRQVIGGAPVRIHLVEEFRSQCFCIRFHPSISLK